YTYLVLHSLPTRRSSELTRDARPAGPRDCGWSRFGSGPAAVLLQESFGRWAGRFLRAYSEGGQASRAALQHPAAQRRSHHGGAAAPPVEVRSALWHEGLVQ